jgi:hypothetical protein
MALVLLGAVSSAYTMLVTPPPLGTDVTAHERRFAALRKALPQRGNVGYVSDTDSLPEVIFLRDYYLTQYTLAPIVVDRRPEGRLVVGNFTSPTGMRQALAKYGFSIKHNFGDGVLLLEPGPIK